jgi:hypothetical protein
LQYYFDFFKIPGLVRLERVSVIPGELSQGMPLYPERFLYRRPKSPGDAFGIISSPFEIFGKACFAFQPSTLFGAGYFQVTFPDKGFKIAAELGKTHKTLKQRPPGLETVKRIAHVVFPLASE